MPRLSTRTATSTSTMPGVSGRTTCQNSGWHFERPLYYRQRSAKRRAVPAQARVSSRESTNKSDEKTSHLRQRIHLQGTSTHHHMVDSLERVITKQRRSQNAVEPEFCGSTAWSPNAAELDKLSTDNQDAQEISAIESVLRKQLQSQNAVEPEFCGESTLWSPNAVEVDPRGDGAEEFVLMLEQALLLDSKSNQTDSSKSSASNSSDATSDSEKNSGENYWLWRGAVLLCSIAWAANFPATKLVDAFDVSVPTLLMLRFGGAAAVSAPFLALAKNKEAISGGLKVGAMIGLGYIGQAEGLGAGGGAGEAAFICSLQVVFVTLLSAWNAKKITSSQALSTALAVAGVGLLELVPELGSTSQSAAVAFDPRQLLLWLQPIAFGYSYVHLHSLMKKVPEDGVAVTAAQMVGVAGMCFAYFAAVCAGGDDGLAGGIQAALEVMGSPQAAGAIVYMALLGTAVTVLLETEALRHMPSSDASVILTTEPLFASMWAVMLLNESLTGPEMAGGALILLACMANEFDPFEVLAKLTAKESAKEA
mmetsp:Transcript_36088/g.43532  ORF Transcript_36088/g.43532 Transcript_36088/m.43532 type:complete len:536 (-) Transcript_36088:280-1887(-)|eukprot:CAMPEP_0197846624 /NCGR_PEP_ID=MMETSP1438-20131217/3864_1 /TAXON_ID=1461541 /ORGANISM="Pterosperma sp., Strain CCMP1384" /LENGTH=535 /DNA_ID=CAMNT_0043458343 /DNA_START=278 /DNA_END=1885 /DNA_ORIENTATION=+